MVSASTRWFPRTSIRLTTAALAATTLAKYVPTVADVTKPAERATAEAALKSIAEGELKIVKQKERALLAPVLQAALWPVVSVLLLVPQRRAPDPDLNRPL